MMDSDYQGSDAALAEALRNSAIVVELDQRGKVLFANEKFAHFLGDDNKNFIGYSLSEYCTNQDIQLPFHILRSALSSQVWHGLLDLRRVDGTACAIDITITPFKGTGKFPYKYVCVGFDATSQKRQKENMKRLMRQEQAYAAQLEAARNELEEKVYERTQELKDSIQYAKRIQSALTPNQAQFDAVLPPGYRSSILYKPRDVVSGDFYRCYGLTDGTAIVAIGDGTGHGVPGAFMSLLGVTGLNKYIEERQMSEPHNIIASLDSELLNILGTEVQDTIEMAVIAIRPGNRVSYSLAMLGGFLVRNHEIIDLESVRRPIGGTLYNRNLTFETKHLTLEKGDTIYFFSDGYHSQLNAENGRPMGKKHFRSLVAEVQHIPMIHERLATLDTFFKNWQGPVTPQTDDILIFALEVS